ncbi:MAG TPA: hypothetical protein VN205_10100 [Thermomonas sp.]|nr:hypothetical protein [Thermomonas sp.]
MCAYTVLDGAAVPARKRRGFVDMAVSRWSPFADPQSHVEWAGDRAMVWAWSRTRALEGGDDQLATPPRRILPESLFRGQPLAEGQELVVLDAGHEGRVWRDNVLVSSHWWADVPPLQDWNEFRRGAGLQPAEALPEPMPYPLAERAWTAPRGQGMAESLGQYRQKALLAVVGVGVAALGALLVGALALKLSIWQVDRQIAAQEQSLGRIIDARDKAIKARAAIESELALRPPAGQVELLALVGELIPGQWQLQEWKMPDAQTLQLTARMPNGDPRAIVAALENSKRFVEVTADMGRQRDTVSIKARVVRAPIGGPAR